MGDASAFETLGLSPGADPAAIERAYKTLIKEHHPDREGGDSARASEINRAYRELRGPRALGPDPLELNEDPFDYRPRRSWVIPAFGVAAGFAALLITYEPISPMLQYWAPLSAKALPATAPSGAVPDPMSVPLHAGAIAAAISDARHLSTTSDEMGLAAKSNDCHRRLRNDPEVAQLDRCAAFDDAVVELQDRDPLRDRGPFSELAVTGRQWSSASALSDDYLAIDGRLDRIRVQVELALADSAPPPEISVGPRPPAQAPQELPPPAR